MKEALRGIMKRKWRGHKNCCLLGNFKKSLGEIFRFYHWSWKLPKMYNRWPLKWSNWSDNTSPRKHVVWHLVRKLLIMCDKHVKTFGEWEYSISKLRLMLCTREYIQSIHISTLSNNSQTYHIQQYGWFKFKKFIWHQSFVSVQGIFLSGILSPW